MNQRWLALIALVATCWFEAAGAAAPPATAVTAVDPVGPVPGPGARVPDAPRNPYADDAASLQEGRQYFNGFNCSGCHGGHAGGGMGPSLRDEDWIYGHADTDIFDSIAMGRAHGMPAWGGVLPKEIIWKLVTYITHLRAQDEPDKPE